MCLVIKEISRSSLYAASPMCGGGFPTCGSHAKASPCAGGASRRPHPT